MFTQPPSSDPANIDPDLSNPYWSSGTHMENAEEHFAGTEPQDY